MRPVFSPFRASWLVVLLALTAFAGPVAGQTPCPDPPLYPPTRASIQPPRPCPGQPVRILFTTCGPCWDIVEASDGPGGIAVRTVQRPDSCIPAVCLPESASVALGSFAAGHHAVVVQIITDRVRGSDGTFCRFVHLDTLEFDVAVTCAQDRLPYVREIVIGSPGPCLGCPPEICPGDSIPVTIRGEFPNGCLVVAGIDLIPHPSASPLPMPPIMRINYETLECPGYACPAVIVPWERHVMLPPLPALANHPYWLQVEAWLRRGDCFPDPDTTAIGEARYPFAVAERCSSNTMDCFLASFATRSTDLGRCDTVVGPDRPGYATFRIGSGVPLHGLEGHFVFDAPHLRVTGIETVGPARGMRFAWQPTDQGARFVLFSSEGEAHIPPAPPLPSSGHVPILRVRVELRPTDAPAPARIRMRASGLLGADADGNGVFGCPIRFLVEPHDAYAVFCTGSTCDFDGEGAVDVRDLVRMVNCITHLMLCTHAPDCDGNGGFDLDDVLCCAHVLLGDGRPDTTGGRPDPSLRVRFGAPRNDAGTVDVPVTIDGANAVSGARLVLRYPSDRFDVAAVEFPGLSTWLELHEVRDGRVVIGLLDMAGAPSAPFRHSFTLRLALRAGHQARGEVTVEAAEFSDPEGVGLVADLGAPSVDLGGGRLALGAGRPNPFRNEVAFAVTLTARSALEVAIYDLSGRLVTSLHRGEAEAGGHTFTWNGRQADGSRAPDGIYFYRARAAGETQSRKVILLTSP